MKHACARWATWLHAVTLELRRTHRTPLAHPRRLAEPDGVGGTGIRAFGVVSVCVVDGCSGGVWHHANACVCMYTYCCHL